VPYKVYKIHDDRRNHTCGFLIPNGGWYHIVEMTFENYQQLQNISHKPGYSADHVEGVVGMYDPDGNQVDPATVEVDSVTKVVVSYEHVNKTRGGKTAPVKSKMVDTERDELIGKCELMGVKIDKRWSNQKIKETLANVGRFRESSLAVG